MKKYLKSLIWGFVALCLTGIILSCSNSADGDSGGSSEKKPVTYTVTFNANDMSSKPAIATQTFTEGKAQALKTIAELGFTRNGYDFAGWGTKSNSTESSYADGDSYTASKDITLYALWTAIPTYTITFNANDASSRPATATQTFTEGKAQALKTIAELGFTRNGYNFAGWSLAPDATQASYADGATYTADSAVTFYAVWSKLYHVTVTTNMYGTGYVDPDTASSGTEITVHCEPENQISSLSATDAYGNPITITNGKFIMPDSDVTVSVEFSFNDTYYINLSELMDVINKLNDSATIVITGDVTKDDLSAIKSAIDGSSYFINLDLSKVTGLTEILSYEFYGCLNLSGISFPASLPEIGFRSFGNCSNLKSVKIPYGVVTIGELAFDYCKELTSIEIPDSVTSIGKSAFSYCSKLDNLVIPDSVESIGEFAFSRCTSLNSITIPSSVSTIGSGAFSVCESLSDIHVDEGNNCFTSINGVLFSKDKKTIIQCPGGKEGDYIMPDSVITIESRAFMGCKKMSSITMSSFVEVIGNSAFSSCKTTASSISIPDSVKYIGKQAFIGFDSLSRIDFCDKNGWYYTDNEEDWKKMEKGKAMPDLSDAVENRKYLQNNSYSGGYDDYYLYKLPDSN